MLKFLKYLAIFVVLLATAGLGYQQFSAAVDRDRYPPPGELVDIGGRNLHLYCLGEATEKPTVILEGGFTFISTGWIRVMKPIAAETRVCAYDCAGYGWSGETSGPRYGLDYIEDLRKLRKAVGMSEPVIIVGHSLGGMLGRIYYNHYPEELAGLVMIEPGTPEILLREFEEEDGEPLERRAGQQTCGVKCPLATAFAGLGLTRLVINNVSELDDPLLPRQAVAEYKARMALSPNVRTMVRLGRYVGTIFYETGDNRDLDDLPVMAIYGTGAGSLFGDSKTEEDRLLDLEKQIAGWKKTTALSSRDFGVVEIEADNHLAIVAHEDSARRVAEQVLIFMNELDVE